MENQSEGLVLKELAYGDRRRILTVFCHKSGIIQLIGNRNKKSPATPLSRIEYSCRESRASDLYHLSEASLLESYDELRNDYLFLEVGGKMMQAILQSQMKGKPAPLLYSLLTFYLRKIPLSPSNLLLSFYLKLLLHDGLLHLQDNCIRCQERAHSLFEGEPLCSSCAPPSALHFSCNQWETIRLLAFSKQLPAITQLKPSQDLGEKLSSLFLSIFS